MRFKLLTIAFLLLFLGSMIPTRAGDDAPGALSALTVGMNMPRATHSATLLLDGTVLIAGGMIGDGQFLDSAELFDPATRKFSPVGNMTAKRTTHAAVLLKNGKVLIIGGYGEGRLSSAELYDPASKTFTSAGSMTAPREGFTATLLDNGQVLIAGGYTQSYRESNDAAELYDPQTNTFTAIGKMNAARASFTATLLKDGRVLIVGGRSGMSLVSSTELYDPVTKNFTPTGNLSVARHKHAAVRLVDGDVLIMGGATIEQSGGEGRFDSAELYVVETGKFMPVMPMHEARYKFMDAVTLLADGRVMIAGAGKSVEIYDPAKKVLAIARGDAQPELFYSTATRLPNGAVLITGGYDYRIRATNIAWYYQPDN